jgi:tRNA threonylcarbamoyladenosine biosynthesis protein TsaB
MKLLAIETATESCSVALAIDGQVRARSALEPRAHAGLLLPWVGELLAEGGIALGGLDALVFSRGPGSFTSLRIGIGVTQGLAWGAGIGVVPVSSLHCAAQVAAGEGVSSAIVALDARMNEVYCGTFQLDAQRVMQPAGTERVCAPGRVTKLESSGWSGVGNGFGRYPQLSDFSGKLDSVHADTWPDAAAMVPLAEHWLQTHEPLPARLAQPVYLRDKVASKAPGQQPAA